ncbi:STAS domain-containing protein [Streptomyces sp. NPDC096094]|uniref:STAS domain-containing protein n=1 Tax=unclassified Streptomyces TaxID=2593676 RepID=UPI00382B67DD
MAETHDSRGGARLSIDRARADGIRILTVHGEIDHTSADQLHEALAADGGEAPPRTVLDLRAVTFMDSSGINILIVAHQTAESGQGWLRLAGPTESVRRVLQLVGLDTVIPCYPTVSQALHA